MATEAYNAWLSERESVESRGIAPGADAWHQRARDLADSLKLCDVARREWRAAAERGKQRGGIAPGVDTWGFLARYWRSMADLLQFLMLRERAGVTRPRGIAPGADAWHMIAEERAGACRLLEAECQEWHRVADEAVAMLDRAAQQP